MKAYGVLTDSCAASAECMLGAYLRYDDYLRRLHEKTA